MGKLLSTAQIAHYREQGYTDPVRVLSAEDAATLRAELEAYEAQSGGPIGGNLRFNSHLVFPWLAALVRHPTVLDAVEDVLGPDLLCWSTTWFIKEAHAASHVTWHQDNTYAYLDSPENLTAWIALTDSTRETGCMQVLPGTHRQQLPHHDTYGANNLLTRGQEADAALAGGLDADRAVLLEPRAGEMTLHHSLLLHTSLGNGGADRRIGFTIRYLPATQRSKTPIRNYATLVRGQDRGGHFEPAAAPSAALQPEMLALHEEVNARHASIILQGADASSYGQNAAELGKRQAR